MKYIRTKDDIFELKPDKEQIINGTHYHIMDDMCERDYQYKEEDVVKSADTIEDLIQIGDIVFYWSSSDDKEHCVVISNDSELHLIKYNVITKLVIPVEEDYKCVAKSFPSFNLIKGKRYLVNKGELALL